MATASLSLMSPPYFTSVKIERTNSEEHRMSSVKSSAAAAQEKIAWRRETDIDVKVHCSSHILALFQFPPNEHGIKNQTRQDKKWKGNMTLLYTTFPPAPSPSTGGHSLPTHHHHHHHHHHLVVTNHPTCIVVSQSIEGAKQHPVAGSVRAHEVKYLNLEHLRWMPGVLNLLFWEPRQCFRNLLGGSELRGRRNARSMGWASKVM